MNILGCLDPPTAGTYRFRGRDVGRLRADELAALRPESFGFVFQSYNLIGSATARENVELPSTYAGLRRVQRADRAGVETVSRAGADAFSIRPGVPFSDRRPTPVRLTLADAEAIARDVDNVRGVSPHLGGQRVLRRGDRQIQASVQAATPDLPAIRGWTLSRGVFFSARDGSRNEPVVVIGAKIRDELFPTGGALGGRVLIGGTPFLVKGVLQRFGRRGSVAADYRDSRVLVPLGTARTLLFGRATLDSITVYARDPKRLGETARVVGDLLARRHGHRGFMVDADIGLRIGFTTVERLLSALIGAVGAISLFVGGMGVTSVMLVSVAERTREIGIRMATGARRRDILRQFLLEAVAVTFAGGVLGTALGFASRFAFEAFDVPAGLSPWFVFAALGCAVATGLAAGIVPARRAAGLDPVAALAR